MGLCPHHFTSANPTAACPARSKPSAKTSSSLKLSGGFPQPQKSSSLHRCPHGPYSLPRGPSPSHSTPLSNTWPQVQWPSNLPLPLPEMLFPWLAPSHCQLKCHLHGEVSHSQGPELKQQPTPTPAIFLQPTSLLTTVPLKSFQVHHLSSLRMQAPGEQR